MHSEILKIATERAKADANISSLVGARIFNFIEADTLQPYLRVQWGEVDDLPDKSEDFASGNLSFDYWTETEGDKEVLDMIGYLNDEFHNQPLVLTLGSTNLLITREDYDTFLESDGISHHGIINFNLLIQD